MARRLFSAPIRMKGGPTLGGSGTRLYVYDDEPLTIVSTLYQRATGVGTQPNPINPNAGKQTSLRTDAASGDTVLNVVTIAGFLVGDLVPVYDLTRTIFRVITALNASGPTMTLDQSLGFAFAATNTLVNRSSMRGHVWMYLDDVRDYFMQPYDVASGEYMPPLQIPVRTPTSSIGVQEEGVVVNSRAQINFIGTVVRAVDNAGSSRVDVTVSDRAYLSGTL